MQKYLSYAYQGIFKYLLPNMYNVDTSNNVIFETKNNGLWILHPSLFYLKDMMEKADIYKIISDNKHFSVIRFTVSPNYGSYLLCYWILDLMDILSNELFFVESKIEIYCEQTPLAAFVCP